ncbi:DUF2501 domain-containing protein [uncultured Sphingomonas sp.]|uniref:DUF2501 domain-containing protein n=1 Tax=uncultured Sphingomonas sp. TaxID=158754 RepID=UPI0035CAE779
MFKLFAFIAAAGLAAAAPAQTTPGAGELAGVLGGALPRVGSIGAGNAAGLLGYCLKNNLLGTTGAAGNGGGLLGGAAAVPSATPTPAAPATGARAILERLLSRPGVQQSPGYKAGDGGQVQTGNGRTLGLDGMQGQLRTQMCKLVLNRAKSFL